MTVRFVIKHLTESGGHVYYCDKYNQDCPWTCKIQEAVTYETASDAANGIKYIDTPGAFQVETIFFNKSFLYDRRRKLV